MMRRGCNIPVEAVEVLKERFPGFDKPLLSRCRYPEKYGVRLTADAEKMLTEKGVEIPRRRRDKRSKGKSSKVTFRTSEAIFDALQFKAEREGLTRMQDAVEKAVLLYLESEETNGMGAESIASLE